MEAARQKTATSAAKAQPAAAPKSVQRKAAATRPALTVQASSKVSSPHDPAEREADATAKKIMRMAVPESSIASVRSGSGGVFRQINKEEKEKQPQSGQPAPRISRFSDVVPFAQERIRRKANSEADAGSSVFSDIENSKSGGSPLPTGVRRFMEPRFQADFSRVRVHTDQRAARLNRQLSARAFATGNHIFFGKERFNPDSREGKELIAHELTHTVQQGGSVQRSAEISITPTQPHIQRESDSKILNWIADKANNIPGFRMFTIVLGVNPITMSGVDRSPANILRALVEFMPGGALITQVLDNHGVFTKIATWIDGKIKALGMVGQMFKEALSTFLDSLGVADLAPWNWGDVWNRAKSIFSAPIDRLIAFAKGVVSDILKFVREAILKPLAALAQGTRGYDLLRALLGEDPVTGEAVPRTAETLIGGFMKLIGEEEIWENIKKGKAVARAWAWFQGALAGLMGLARAIPGRIVATLTSLTFRDIITVAGAFGKIVGLFAGIVGDFFSWGVKTVWNLLEIVFDVVKPGAMGYVKKAGAALKGILKNPLPFVKNLAAAAKLGFEFFKDNIWTHLKNGLIEWLTGSLNGVYIPKALSLSELGKFALSVLGITWANIRAKIVKTLGDKGETIVNGIEKGVEWAMKGFEIVRKLATGGIAAAWELIQEKLSELKDTVVNGIIDFVVESVIKKAIPKLISMFIPGAGFISAIISIYDIIMVIVQKIAKIAAVVTGFVNSIMEIAAGNIRGAAIKVNNALAGMLSLAISLFAGFVGLGKVSDKVNGVIMKVRDKVDKAIDATIKWIVDKAKALFGRLFGGKGKQAALDPDVQKRLNAGLAAIEAAEAPLMKDGKLAEEDAQKVAASVKSTHPVFKSLRVVQSGDHWEYDYVVNPPGKKAGAKSGVKSYLGATRIGKSKSKFKGSFGDPAWNWSGYPTKATPHPANLFAKSPNAASVPQPTGTYSVTGAGTEGNLSTDKWRTHIDKQKNTEKEKLQKKYPKWKATDLENTAKSMIETRYNKMGWKDLYLLDWDQHHIHPVNWKGRNRTSNMQYLRRYSEHSPLTSWWNSRKATILANL